MQRPVQASIADQDDAPYDGAAAAEYVARGHTGTHRTGNRIEINCLRECDTFRFNI
jgi:hypothetical protein